MATELTPSSPPTGSRPSEGDTRFVNAMRLGTVHWLAVAAAVTVVVLVTPGLWKRIERFETNEDYRIPYALSKDYWLYERRLERSSPKNVVVIGDSVIWGEYVLPDGTLSHFLNRQSGQPGRFLNGGVNGMFPLALEGLIRHDGRSLRRGKVILHCNVLWMSSPKADLHTEKEQPFNHANLVPQFWPRIPCYKADLNRRLVAVIERNLTLLQWASHLQIAYFRQQNLLAWTLEEDGHDPPCYPNAYRNPFAQITLTIPAEPAVDPERGPASPRHKPWSTTGKGSTRFEWVEPDRSLQWAAFERLVKLLQSRGNDVLVLVGPFNEHMLAEDNRPAFHHWRDTITKWLVQNRVPHVVPATLPSPLYADASHPLTEGYEQLADSLSRDAAFVKWLDRQTVAPGP